MSKSEGRSNISGINIPAQTIEEDKGEDDHDVEEEKKTEVAVDMEDEKDMFRRHQLVYEDLVDLDDCFIMSQEDFQKLRSKEKKLSDYNERTIYKTLFSKEADFSNEDRVLLWCLIL